MKKDFDFTVVDNILAKYPAEELSTIAILQDVQEYYHYLPEEVFPHIAKAIMKKYPEKNLTIDDVFDNYIGNRAPAYVPVNDFQTEAAIELLKRNHCLVVIAHPLFIEKIDYHELLKLDIDGIEGFYFYSTETDDEVVKTAEELGLVVTGGSDYHGPITRDTIGKAYLEKDKAKTFLKRINI